MRYTELIGTQDDHIERLIMRPTLLPALRVASGPSANAPSHDPCAKVSPLA